MYLFLILHNVGMMLGSNKANRAKDEGVSMLNILYKTWDEEMIFEMRLFLCGKNHFIYVSHVLMMMLEIIWLSLSTS